MRKGTGKESGRPYEIAEVTYAINDKPGEKRDEQGRVQWTYECYGQTTRQLPLDPACLKMFADCAFPSVLDLKLSPQPERPEKNWCTGFTPAAK